MFTKQWFLLDATWSKGISNKLNPLYFLLQLESLWKDHFPFDKKWTLLVNLPKLKTFRDLNE
ncbi:MAG: hypothetical protein M3004_12180 [Bacteroidota bacterium]|nr:hypothetical protein [Bacteroidota bacterium]